MSDLMVNAPIPQLIDRDPEKITLEMIAEFERLTGKTLYPAQPEMLFINFMAYREVLLREAVQDAGLQNLVRFARGEMLDEIAKNYDEVARLPAQSARCDLEFSLGAPLAVPLVIPAGTRVGSQNGRVTMATLHNATLLAGSLTIVVASASMDAGVAGNGYIAGQITELLTGIAGATPAVRNVTETRDGSEAEDDARFRDRLLDAPEAYSVAGPVGAYRFFAKSAHPDIIDVHVATPQPGSIALYPLMRSGLPSQSILDAVLLKCSSEDRRPLCDSVSAIKPTEIAFSVGANLTLYSSANVPQTLSAARASLDALLLQMRSQLGSDIVPSQITAALQVPGVKRVELPGLIYKAVAQTQWSRCTAVAINLTGVEDG
ncbi:baseplate assembly protein [Deefgea piscis]|uniref:baseplate assembly protein n=1 Tax=Deefgea piscis TaxID=2739061 RepID=UPI001C7E7512|nr:baseplate J/gp47 family protein [Deefgea piscis]QZA80229.1 baseplate J/gp47 family protein [Deefgea piscis]